MKSAIPANVALLSPKNDKLSSACACSDWALAFADLIMIFIALYFFWLTTRDRSLAFKLPMTSKHKDKNNEGPGRSGQPEGILYLGNVDKTNEEAWFTNSDGLWTLNDRPDCVQDTICSFPLLSTSESM